MEQVLNIYTIKTIPEHLAIITSVCYQDCNILLIPVNGIQGKLLDLERLPEIFTDTTDEFQPSTISVSDLGSLVGHLYIDGFDFIHRQLSWDL